MLNKIFLGPPLHYDVREILEAFVTSCNWPLNLLASHKVEILTKESITYLMMNSLQNWAELYQVEWEKYGFRLKP